MRIPRRWLARLTVATTAPIAAGMLSIAPASAAGTGCLPAPIDNAQVCVDVDEGSVFGDIHIVPGASGGFQTATVYVQQCRPDFTNCGVIAANSGGHVTDLQTSRKNAPFGHIFHGCASWTDDAGRSHTNKCGQWRSWP